MSAIRSADRRDQRANRPRIGLILTRHPAGRVSPILPEVARNLAARGATVSTIHPDDRAMEISQLRVDQDLYVLKSGTEAALSLAGALDAAGATILNPYAVAAACRDKVVMTRTLRRVGVPQPQTWLVTDPSQLQPMVAGAPLVLKPVRGSQGRGVRIVSSSADVAGTEAFDEPVIAQRYHEPSGRDRKLYRIGHHVFGVKRRWPAVTYRDKLGEAFEVRGGLGDIVLRCGTAFGIDLYGVDVIETADGPLVVDFSSFPGFKGVPAAASRLADYIWAAADAAMAEAPVLRPSSETWA